MTATGAPTTPAEQPALPPGGRPAWGAHARATAGIAERFRTATSTTPGRLRLWSVGAVAALVATALAGILAAAHLRSSTDRLRRNTGPVLVATQQLVASLAEADAAATAAFLAGRDEDREQRRLYEQALARAHHQIEDVSALLGEDAPTHVALKDISVDVTRYAGLVEAARASNRAGVAGSESYLVDALDLLATGVAADLDNVTTATQARLARDEQRRSRGTAAAVGLAAVAIAILVAAQAVVTRRTRRVLNPPLVAATALVLLAAAWLAVAERRSGGDLDRARRLGYESIALTARIQATGYRAKADETIALITGDAGRRASAERAALELIAAPVTPVLAGDARAGRPLAVSGLLAEAARAADSDRERAAVAEMLVRWQRYRDTVDAIRSAPAPAAARTLAVGPASSAFNGFNFSVESVLGDNRAQFLEGLDAAARRVRGLGAAVGLLPLLAAAAAVAGFQLRIKEYR